VINNISEGLADASKERALLTSFMALPEPHKCAERSEMIKRKMCVFELTSN
jgi:hypothetical protein